MKHRWIRWVLIALCATPSLDTLGLILRYGVDVPHWDQWDNSLAGLYIKSADGQLTLRDFTVQHNEHRILVPRVLSFIVNWITGWNTVIEMLLVWLVVCITSAGILWIARQTVGQGRLDARVLFLWFLSNLMLFTPCQHENWLWGMGLVNVLAPLFLVAAMAIVYTPLPLPWRVGLAGLMCFAAMFSLGNGLFAFPLIAILWLGTDSIKGWTQKRNTLLIWAGVFGVGLMLFVYGYSRPPVAAGLEGRVVTLSMRAMYLLAFLGTQFTALESAERYNVAMASGAGLLCLFLGAVGYMFCLRFRWKASPTFGRMLPWALLGLYVILSALLASVFRTIVGIENAVSSRYVTFTLYLPIALIHLVPLVFEDLRKRFPSIRIGGAEWPLAPACMRIPAILATLLVIGHLINLPATLRASRFLSIGRRQSKAALDLINALPDNPKLARAVYPNVSQLLQMANRLDKLGYLRPRLVNTRDANLLRDPRFIGEDASRVGVFERMGESSPNVVTASGWALIPETLRPADTIVLTFANDNNEQVIFANSAGVSFRQDLVASRSNSAYEIAGWIIDFSVSTFPPGSSALIRAWAIDADTGKLRLLQGEMHLVRAAAPAP